MRLQIPSQLLLLLCAGAAGAQHPRTPLELGDADDMGVSAEPAIGTAGDLSVVAFNDQGEILVTRSDGRGVAWDTPQRVDAGTAGTRYTTSKSVRVVGDHIYVAWIDTRWGNTEVYLARSFNGGNAWSPEARIDNGQVVGAGGVLRWSFDVTPDPGGGADHVYFLFNTLNPLVFSGSDIYLTASHNAGNLFLPARAVSSYPAGSTLAYHVDLVARGGTRVHMVWQDGSAFPVGGAAGQDVWYQRSTDGGVSLLAFAERLNGTLAGKAHGRIALDVEGADVLAAWDDGRHGPNTVYFNYSNGLGGPGSWLASEAVAGGYTPGVDTSLLGDVGVDQGRLMIAWSDDRTSLSEVYVQQLSPPAVVWSEHRLSTGDGNKVAHIAGTGSSLGVSWIQQTTASILVGGGFRRTIQASSSQDGGASWGAPITIGETDDVEQHTAAFNDRYDNFLHTWVYDDPASLPGTQAMAGGYRPQTLGVSGALIGGSTLTFDAEHFPAAEAGHSFLVALSGGVGNLSLPGPAARNIGLLHDPIFSVGLAIQGAGGLLGTLDALGNGSTSLTLPAGYPPGLQLFGVAISFDPGAGVIHSITDVERL